MSMDRSLLVLAESLNVEAKEAAPRRRAVSTAYYAVFHRLARLRADEFIGSGAAQPRGPEYEKVYRALEHGGAKAKFLNVPRVIDAIRQIGNRFVLLQSKRRDADYRSSDFAFVEAESFNLIDAARQAIDLIDQLSPQERRALAVRLVIRDRVS